MIEQHYFQHPIPAAFEHSAIDFSALPKQPHILRSYWNVGLLLHLSLIIFVFESWLYYTSLSSSYQEGNFFLTIFWAGSVLFAFSHIFLVVMDGWSRFQNYKRIKDNLFLHGFNPRMAYPYMGSKCQRSAFLVAAAELGLQQQVSSFYERMGIRWYHFVPRFMVQDPLFLFKRSFLSRTFLEKYYAPKFDFHQLYQRHQSTPTCLAEKN
ncbi:hypothetical protein [Pedobacter frigidisoli]|uniref:hypothetical protein n=1 Tax=Pedobacter frigidisoli TaxID=2530455 RepID=UPI002930E4B5|nr:hypothetical protein [Pedobacter frigidisoli]